MYFDKNGYHENKKEKLHINGTRIETSLDIF